MVKKTKNIFNLVKIFLKNILQTSNIINKKTKKINKKSIYVWLIIIVMVAITYASYKVIEFLVKTNEPTIFLGIFFLILLILMIFQVLLASINVYFFSKDLELILPLPIKPKEIITAKFITLVITLYFTEAILAIIPLGIYGVYTEANLIYYIYTELILIVFPILPTLIVSIIMMFTIKLSRFIKNKDIFQIIITLIFIIIISYGELEIGNSIVTKIENSKDVVTEQTVVKEELTNFNNKIRNVNKYFLQINPAVNLLDKSNKFISIIELLKILFMDSVIFIIFIFIGDRSYLKNVLKSNNYSNNKFRPIKLNKIKKKKMSTAYINKEFKVLLKSPIFFMQCVFPELILILALIVIAIVLAPNIRAVMEADIMGDTNFSFDLGVVGIILAMTQIIFTMSNISITGVSREGKNAIYMKFLPINYYKQFLYKSLPQFIINMLFIVAVLIMAKLMFMEISFIYLIILFILSNLLNVINSELMLLIDLTKPNLNWDAEYDVMKQNNKKIFQYVLTVGIILLINYFHKIFEDFELIVSCISMIIILMVIILLMNKIIKISINQLFRNIN